jgi:hypothetical protein
VYCQVATPHKGQVLKGSSPQVTCIEATQTRHQSYHKCNHHYRQAMSTNTITSGLGWSLCKARLLIKAWLLRWAISRVLWGDPWLSILLYLCHILHSGSHWLVLDHLINIKAPLLPPSQASYQCSQAAAAPTATTHVCLTSGLPLSGLSQCTLVSCTSLYCPGSALPPSPLQVCCSQVW